jgi:hypothetical protein
VTQGSPFSAKSQIRDLLATASTDIFVVDPYMGVGTLDCLGSVVDTALADFQKEGFQIEIRRVDKLHDRHLIFNGR